MGNTNETIKQKIAGKINKKTKEITDTTFGFTKNNLQYALKYRGNKNNSRAHDKRFDSNTESLCLFISPKEEKTFYACKHREMYNSKKGRTEKNTVYKKIFRLDPDANCGYADAKIQLKEVLKEMDAPIEAKADKQKFEYLALRFYKEGMTDSQGNLGPRLDDPEMNYKQSTVTKYKAVIDQDILMRLSGLKRGSKANKLNKDLVSRLTRKIIFKNRVSSKPFKDYFLDEIGPWHIECIKERMKETKSMANQIIGMIITIYKWAQINNIYKGENLAKLIKFFKNRKIKAKLFDEDRDKILEHVEGKAFDYQPHFLTCLGMLLLTGQRITDIFGLRWKPPVSDKEKGECTGWLFDNWENERHFKIYDMKNREEMDIFIDDRTLALLKRLDNSLRNDAHCWAVQSPFIFPQRKNQRLHAEFSSYRDQLKKLNKKLDIKEIQGDVQNTRKGYKKNAFTFKLTRKTLGTYIDETEGIEMAAEKLNHKNTKTTRDHYIVKDRSKREINNIYRKRPAPSPWNTHVEQAKVKEEDIRLFVKNKKSK